MQIHRRHRQIDRQEEEEEKKDNKEDKKNRTKRIERLAAEYVRRVATRRCRDVERLRASAKDLITHHGENRETRPIALKLEAQLY